MVDFLINVDTKKCDFCFECVELCSGGALQRLADEGFFFNEKTCSYCEVCMDICPEGAIKIIDVRDEDDITCGLRRY